MKKILILFLTLYISNTLFSKTVIFKKFFIETKKKIIFRIKDKKKLNVKINKVSLNEKGINAFFYKDNFNDSSKVISYNVMYPIENKFTVNLNNLKKGLYYIKVYDKFFSRYYKLLITDSTIVAKRDNNNNFFISFLDSKTGKPYSKYTILYSNKLIRVKKMTTKISSEFDNKHIIIAYKSNSIDYIDISNKNSGKETNKIVEIIPKKNDFYIGESLEFSVIFRLKNDAEILTVDVPSIIISVLDSYKHRVAEKKVNNIINGIYKGSFKIDDKYREGRYYIVVKWGNYVKKYPLKIYKKRKNRYLFYFSGLKNTYFNSERIKIKIQILNKFGAPLERGILRCNVLAKNFSSVNYRYYKTISTDVDDGEAFIRFKPNFLKKNNYIVKLIFKVRSNNGYIEGDYKLLNILNSAFSLEVTSEKNIYELNKKILFNYRIKKVYGGDIKKIFFKIYKINDIENEQNKTFFLQRYLKPDSISGNISLNIDKTGYYKAVFILVDNLGNRIKKEKYFWIISYIYGVNIKKNLHKIFLNTDKNSYSFSDIGKALILLPQKNMWVNIALERNKIYKEKYIFSEKKFILFDFPINEKYSPNVYLTVTGVKNNKFYYKSKNIIVPKISKFIKLNTTLSNKESLPQRQNLIKLKALNYWNHDINTYIMATTINNGFYNFYSITIPNLIKKWYSDLKNNILCLNNPSQHKNNRKKVKNVKESFVYSKYFLDSTLNYKLMYVAKNDIYGYKFKYNDIVGYWRTLFVAVNEDSKYGVKSVISKAKKDLKLDYYFPKRCFLGDVFYFTVFGKNYLSIRQKLKINYFIVNGRYGSSLQKDIYIPPQKYNTVYIKTIPKAAKTMKIGISAFLPERIERQVFYIDIKKTEVVREKRNEYISIRKKYYYLKYKESNNNYYSRLSSTGDGFEYGDDILTEIRIKSKKKYYNLKVFDFIPAGCEIVRDIEKFHLIDITPNINYGRKIKNEKIVFKIPTLEKGKYYIYYIMKAKFKGTFIVPPLFIKQKRKIIYSDGEINKIEVE